jgi:predicted HicB family RNase H-like nuclease
MAEQLKTEIQINMYVDEDLWINAKIQAVKRRMLLKSWIAEAIQEKVKRENLPQ